VSGLVYRFHRHSARKARIADKRADVKIFAFFIARDRHSQSGGKRCRSVSRAERVENRFVALQKTAQAAVLFYRFKLVAPARQNFMRVSLMTDIPDKFVVWRVENVVHSYC
jgi:hypothetical protein